MTLFTLWLWPLLALVLLPGILVYFGLHVVRREVIFVDLALAQLAALGACVAIAAGLPHEGGAAVWALSLAFTLAGAALFSGTRGSHPRVPHEAIIGIIYIVAAAFSILVLSRTAEGAEEIRDMLVGNILLVNRGQVLRTFALFAGIGALHWLLRGSFLRVSFDPEGAARAGMRVRRWDFLFYVTFGLVVTSFVPLAGVYLVFTFLIVPAVCGALLSSRIGTRLWIGWAVALVSGVAGLVLSTQWESMDLPTGPTIVCVFGAVLIFCAILRRILLRTGRLAD